MYFFIALTLYICIRIYLFATSENSDAHHSFYITKKPENLIQNTHTLLITHLHFYNKISSTEQHIFCKKIVLCLKNISFKTTDSTEVPLNTRILICASIVQVTYGLPIAPYSFIKRITVTLDELYLGKHIGYVKGFFDRKGSIHLSMKNFMEGYAYSNDGVNLGLHETAHALEILYLRKIKNFNYFFDVIVYNWYHSAIKNQHISTKTNPNKIFREYAQTNRHEFFAICVENFFERPLEMKSTLPEIYQGLQYILRINPETYTKPIGNDPIYSNADFPLFSETVNTKQIYLTIFFAICVILFVYYYNSMTINILAFASMFFLGLERIISFFKMKQMIFFDKYIRFQSIFGINTTDINTGNVFAITVHNENSILNQKKLSFLYYQNNSIKIKHDLFYPTSNFIEQIQVYCNKKKITFIDKQ